MKIIIIGNGAAGIAAAEAVRKKDADAEIIMLNSERYYHYSRPRVIEFLAGKVSLEQITIKNSEFYEKNRIRLVMLVKVEKIDPAKKTVYLEGGIDETYDKLIIAAGAYSFLPPVEGSDSEGVFTLRTIDDAKAIIEYAKDKNEAVLVGGGLLGIEAAISLTALGLKTTVVEVFDRLLPRQLDAECAAHLQKLLEEKSLNFLLPRQSASIVKDGAGLKLNFKDGSYVSAGLILFSAGIRCSMKLAEGSGLAMDKGIKVNNYMETNIPDIYACGDIAEYNGMVYGIWPAAREQGTAAGLNAAGEKTEYKGSVLSTKLKVAGIDLASLGNIEAGAGVEAFVKKEGSAIKKIFIKDGKISGAILLGETSKYQALQELMKKGAAVSSPENYI